MCAGKMKLDAVSFELHGLRLLFLSKQFLAIEQQKSAHNLRRTIQSILQNGKSNNKNAASLRLTQHFKMTMTING